MPIVINDLEVTQEQPTRGNPETSAVGPSASVKPDPEEIRRLLVRIAERLSRLQAT